MHDEPSQKNQLDLMVQAYHEAEREVSEARPVRELHKRQVLNAMLDKERQRTHAELVPHRPVVWGGMAALAALCALGVGFALLSGDGAEQDVIDEPGSGGMVLRPTTPECHITPSGDEALTLSPACTWEWDAHFTHLSSATGEVQLTPLEQGLRVERGEVFVDVDPRRPRSFPVRLWVSGGVIEVVGTRFTIREFSTHGEVTLHKGSIRFSPDDGGEPVMIEPGQTWRWGAAPDDVDVQPLPDIDDSQPDVSPDDTSAVRTSVSKPERRRPRTPEQVEEEARLTARDMRTVRRHRRLGERGDAIKLLDALSTRTSSSTTREVISYEKGDILSEMDDVKRQCAHWRRHLKRFPKGRYVTQVQSRHDALTCSP